MEKARRRHRHLHVASSEPARERELVERDAARPSDRPHGIAGLPANDVAGIVAKLEERVAGLQTVERPNESRRPGDTPELSVRDRAETRLLLERDRCADRAVLDLTETLVVELALAMRSERILQLPRAEQTADVLGTMRQRAHDDLRAADPLELATAASTHSRRARWSPS